MAGWPIDRIGQCFRQPVFSLPKCPISSPCHLLFCFVSAAVALCLAADRLRCSPVTPLAGFLVSCAVLSPQILSLCWFHFHHLLGKMFFPVLGDAGPLLWEYRCCSGCRSVLGRKDRTSGSGKDQAFTWLLCLWQYGEDEEGKRREEAFFSVRLKPLGFSSKLVNTWWYSYFTKQRFGEILVLIFHWSPMPAGIAWWEEGGAGKFTLAPLDLSAYGQSKEASRFPQLHCSGLRTLCFGAKKPESWGFVCKSKCLLSQDLVNPWGRLSAGIVSVCTARTCPRLVGE